MKSECHKIDIPARIRVGVTTSALVAWRLIALAERGVVGAVTDPSRNGGIFSLLASPSSTEVVVRARLGLGVLSGVCSCSQLSTDDAGTEETWCPLFPRTELRVSIFRMEDESRSEVVG